MSYWTYVHGTIVVSPMGRTQAEKRYILETVLDHLPVVSGSERDMTVYILERSGYSTSCSHNEFGEPVCRDTMGKKYQNKYILVVDGALRDRMFNQTFREFQKWLCRLAKRVDVEETLVEINDGYYKSSLIRNLAIEGDDIYETVYGQMFEDPTWVQRRNGVEYGEPNWCEYLMWDRAKNSDYPMMLGYKYYGDHENDAEVERRLRYRKGK